MTGSNQFPTRHAPWLAPILLIAMWVAACGDDPLAPASCGPLPQVTVTVGETSSVNACFNDANGDVLTLQATSSNPSVATASLAGTSITVTGIAPGNATVTVTASDPGGLQAQSSFQVMVPNRAPEPRGTMPSVRVPAGRTATVDASQYFWEPDGETLSYTAGSSDAEVAGASVAGSVVTVTAESKGSATITVTARDPGGLSATQSFVLTVPNRPPEPVGGIGAQTIEVGQSVTLDVAGSFSDPDGDALTYTAVSSITAVASTSVSGSAVTITAAAPGTAVITITARDDEQATATQQVNVTVPQPNRAPRPVGSIPAQTVQVGGRATVNASQYFSDPDGDALTYSATSSNSGVARASVSGSTVTITGASAGSATITITARDPEGLTATQQVRVTVPQPNRAPRRVGSIPAQTISVGGRGTVNASQYFSDPDGDALTYSAVSSNSGVARASVSGSTVTITGAGAGSATITVTARDPGGLSATQQARVTVSQGNRAPRPQGTIPSKTINADGSAGVNASQYFSDPDGDALTYSATSSNSSVARASVSGSWVTVMGVSAGSATITVTARDPGGLSATQRFSVTVRSAGAPDLQVPTVTPTSVTGSPGDTVWATFTLRNSGSAASAATTVRVLISSDANISESDAEIDDFQIRALNAEETLTRQLGLILAVTEGTGYWGICIEAVPGESNTGNNCSQGVRVTVRASGGPDLEFTGISPRTVIVTSGTAFTLKPIVANTGGATAPATKIKLMLSNDSTIGTSDRVLASEDLRAIAPSRTLTISYKVTLTGRGSGFLGFCIDPVAGETNTTNNCSPHVRLTLLSSGNQTADDGAAGSFLLVEHGVLRIESGALPEDSGAHRDLAIGAIIHFEGRREP